MIKLMDLLNEGVYDKGVLKAIFMAGGPGSGKSYITKGLFGIPEKSGITSMYGLKVVNSDAEFEHYLRKFGFDTETGAGYGKGTLDLDLWPQEVWDMVGGDQTPEDAEKDPNLRAMTKKLTSMRKSGYMNTRLGMIIDGTARDYSKIAGEKNDLEELALINSQYPGEYVYLDGFHNDIKIIHFKDYEIDYSFSSGYSSASLSA